MKRNLKRIKIKALVIGSTLLLLFVSSAPSDAIPASGCLALAAQNGNIVVVDQLGNIRRSVQANVRDNRLLALSNDGTAVALVDDGAPDVLRIFDPSGSQSTASADMDFSGDDDDDRIYQHAPLVALSWATSGVVKVEKHISPSNSRFEFYGVSGGNIARISRPGIGLDCDLNTATGQIACIQGATITVGGQSTQVVDIAAMGAVVTDVDLSANQATPIHTDLMDFNVTFLGNSGGGADLKVELLRGQSKQQLVPSGQSFALEVDAQLVVLTPSATGDASTHLTVRTAPTSSQVMAPSIHWVANTDRLITAERFDGGHVIASRYVRASNQWVSFISPSLNRNDSIEVVRGLDNGNMLVRTDRGFATASVNFSDSPFGFAFGSWSSLPGSINVVQQDGSQISTPALEWICSH